MDNEQKIQEDRRTVEGVLAGDTELFSGLIARYKKRVFSIVSKRVPPEDAEETAHDVFVRAFRSLASFSFRSPFENWIAGIAVRTCLDYWRKSYRSREVSMSTLSPEHEEWLENALESGSGDRFESRENALAAKDLLDWTLSRMSPEDRAVLELVHLEERSVRETAEMLGWSPAKVKIRAFRARKKARAIIGSARSSGKESK